MRDLHSGNFGLAIAYLLPGFVVLVGISLFSDTVQLWLSPEGTQLPTVGGFLYGTLASLAAGLTVGTVRWAIIDTLHHITGIRRPQWNFGRLQRHFDAYDRLEQNHYRYYQWYGGMVIALAFVEACRFVALGLRGLGLVDVGMLLLAIIFYTGSRDSLRKYYTRVEQLLGSGA